MSGNNWKDPDVVAAFCAAWNGTKTADDIAVEFGLGLKSVYTRATALRRKGHHLRCRMGAPGKLGPATVMTVLSEEHRVVLARASRVRSTTGYRLINDLIATLLDEPNLLDNVLDDGVTTPGGEA